MDIYKPDLALNNLKWLICQKTQPTQTKYILFTKPSAREGSDTRSIFKRSLTAFNSEFSFS